MDSRIQIQYLTIKSVCIKKTVKTIITCFFIGTHPALDSILLGKDKIHLKTRTGRVFPHNGLGIILHNYVIIGGNYLILHGTIFLGARRVYPKLETMLRLEHIPFY